MRTEQHHEAENEANKSETENDTLKSGLEITLASTT